MIVCVCLDVKEERWLKLAVKGGTKKFGLLN